jgi:hypothetical protein
VIAKHAEQFDVEVPDRVAGSQQEFVAASYITGHLQQAGYLVQLESVPVANTVRSSDVIALPPAGGKPTVVVTTSIDTKPGTPAGGGSIGAFLETARALRVAEPNHSVEFAALGANATGDLLGTRRLVALLQDASAHPHVVEIEVEEEGEGFWARGPAAPALAAIARDDRMEPPPSSDGDDPVRVAGLAHTEVGGDPVIVARVLLEWLKGSPS